MTASETTPAGTHLPKPDERPAADVVIYDDHCRFCRANVEIIARCDARGRLAFLSLHDPETARRFPDLSHEQLMREMYVVDRHGGRHAGAGAFRYLSRSLPWLWPLAPLLHIPYSMPLWQWIYGQVAQRRYLFGKRSDDCPDGSCRLHGK